MAFLIKAEFCGVELPVIFPLSPAVAGALPKGEPYKLESLSPWERWQPQADGEGGKKALNVTT